MEETASTRPKTIPRPLWVPEGVKFDELPLALQHAIAEIVNPAYEELVAGAQTPLEKGQGFSYVSLLFWELLGQCDLGEDWGRKLPFGGDGKANRAKLRRHMRLVHLKDKVGKFVHAVQKFYAKAGELDPLNHLPR